MDTTRRDRVRGAVLGALVGDALGAPFEGAPFEDSLSQRVERHAERVTALGYTDDSAMLLVVAETLAARGRVEQHRLLGALREAYDPARGYGRGMKLLFSALDDGATPHDAARAAWPEGSWGNGAAVRVAPVACRWPSDPARLQLEAERSARCTHAHPLGLAGAVVQAFAVAHALRAERTDASALLCELGARVRPEGALLAARLAVVAVLLEVGAPPREAVNALGDGVSAAEAVPLGLYAWLRAGSDFSRAVLGSIALGGDADSRACLVGALAGARLGVRAIPARWLRALEGGPRGKQHLLRLADVLAEASLRGDGD